MAAARLVREVHAAKALLKACPLSSAPHDSGVLAPDERCNDLVRAVDKSEYARSPTRSRSRDIKNQSCGRLGSGFDVRGFRFPAAPLDQTVDTPQAARSWAR